LNLFGNNKKGCIFAIRFPRGVERKKSTFVEGGKRGRSREYFFVDGKRGNKKKYKIIDIMGPKK
jgi:hypothetical protein